MINKEIIEYIRSQIQAGRSNKEIKGDLLSSGWRLSDIDEAFLKTCQSLALSVSPDVSPYSYEFGMINKYPMDLPSAIDIFKKSWKNYKRRYKTYLGIMFIPVMIFILLIALIWPVLSREEIIFSPASIFSTIFFLFFLAIIFQYWSQTALICAIKDCDENIGIAESYRRGRKKVRLIFRVGLLSSILILVGCAFFIIPGIIFSIWFSFAVLVVICENRSGMEALLKSKFYVSGYWWEVLWRFIFIFLVFVSLAFLFSVAAFLLFFLSKHYNNSLLFIFGLLLNVTGYLMIIFLSPLVAIYSYYIYSGLKYIKGEAAPILLFNDRIKFIITGVLGILAVAAMITVPSFIISNNDWVSLKSTNVIQQSEIDQIRILLDIYAIEHNGVYPETLDQLSGVKKSDSDEPAAMSLGKNKKYEYRQLNGGKEYELCSRLDASKNKCFNHF